VLRKTKLLRISYLVLFAIAIAFASWRLPAYASRLPWLMLIAVADLYWFWCLSKPLNGQDSIVRRSLIISGSIPSAMLLVFSLSMAFMSPVDWNPVFRTYLFGAAVFLYILRFPPLLVFLFSDLKGLVLRKRPTTNTELLKSLWFRMSLVFSLIMAVIMTFGMTLWVYDFEIVEGQIPIHNLPPAFEGFRIVHISDSHLGRWHSTKPLQRAITMVNSLDPDIIAFTGDLVNYSTSEAWSYKEILSGLKANDGIFAVLGNHDYGDYMRWPSDEAKQENINKMFWLMNDLGWTLLENKHTSLYREGDCLTIAGTGHYSTKAYIPDRADFKLALSGLPDACLLILLTHTPEALGSKEFQDQPIDLILSGHTHAMQLGLRIGGKSHSPAAFIYRHWGGLYEPEELNRETGYLYVNRGLGHIAFPMRIGMKPEITLITLTNRTGND
jgi:predicted MPP superfamily phosphohydrolase